MVVFDQNLNREGGGTEPQFAFSKFSILSRFTNYLKSDFTGTENVVFSCTLPLLYTVRVKKPTKMKTVSSQYY